VLREEYFATEVGEQLTLGLEQLGRHDRGREQSRGLREDADGAELEREPRAPVAELPQPAIELVRREAFVARQRDVGPMRVLRRAAREQAVHTVAELSKSPLERTVEEERQEGSRCLGQPCLIALRSGGRALALLRSELPVEDDVRSAFREKYDTAVFASAERRERRARRSHSLNHEPRLREGVR
jgi:hypothetical protein